jgi:hypothetical protein
LLYRQLVRANTLVVRFASYVAYKERGVSKAGILLIIYLLRMCILQTLNRDESFSGFLSLPRDT